MQVYLVGGAVRDQLLNLPVRERDWVVVGARPEDLQSQGFIAVGREFPVFLHPETHEEYALARLERKTAPGYRGFVTEFSPNVSLHEDLARRDLTINAMAQDIEGTIIDPYQGRADLQARRLRHVSPAFVEDPVRILRVARFAARFTTLGFSVAPETSLLMRSMIAAGEVAALVAERIWQETDRALATARPDVYFQVLQDCDALSVIFPEVAALHDASKKLYLDMLRALRKAARLNYSAVICFAVLMRHFAQGDSIEQMAARLKIPNEYRDLAALTAEHHGTIAKALNLDPATILKLLERCDAFRRKERFENVLRACGAYLRKQDAILYLRAVLSAVAEVTLSEPERQGLQGEAIRLALHNKRLNRLTEFRESHELV
jgi:tRNA nucleotidyltransferase (CCA-adding enzyme)